jgi:hypothetical protein
MKSQAADISKRRRDFAVNVRDVTHSLDSREYTDGAFILLREYRR